MDKPYDQNFGRDRHIFFSSTNIIPVGALSDSPRTSALLRDAFSNHVRRRPSVSSIRSMKDSVKESQPRYFPFTFDMPIGHHRGQGMPPTCSTSSLVTSGIRGRSFAEKAEVTYKVTAIWEPSDSYENRARQVYIYISFISSQMLIITFQLSTGSKFRFYCNPTMTSDLWM